MTELAFLHDLVSQQSTVLDELKCCQNELESSRQGILSHLSKVQNVWREDYGCLEVECQVFDD
jgi:hypothetical protein